MLSAGAPPGPGLSTARISRRHVFVEPTPGAEIQASFPDDLESATAGELPQILSRVRAGGGERRQRNELRFPREIRDQESSEGIAESSGNDFGERRRVPTIGETKRIQVTPSLLLQDHRRGITRLDEKEVQDEAPNATIAIDERMDPLEPRMVHGSVHDGMHIEACHRRGTPVREIGRDRCRLRDSHAPHPHPSRPQRSWAIPRRWRFNLPGERHGEAVELRDDLEGDSLACRRLSIGPIGGASVALDVEYFDQVGTRTSILHDLLDLGSGHGVALDRRRVMDVVDPDLAEDGVGFDGPRETTEVFVEKSDLLVHASKHLLNGRASVDRFPTLTLRH
jgi:hypothetical protein